MPFLNNNYMKQNIKILAVIYLITVASFTMTSCSSCSSRNQHEEALNETEMENLQNAEPEYDILTTHGRMRIKLYSKTPKHRDNFVKLAEMKYYNGIRFHRVIEGFMIQAGDPYSRDTSLINMWGQGGPEYTVSAEFIPEYTHKKGALAAARKGDMANPKKASSGSQFYIVHDENSCSHLDGQYSIFGEVVEGFEIIDRIASVPVDRMDRPLEDVIIISVKPVVKEPEIVEQGDTLTTKEEKNEK